MEASILRGLNDKIYDRRKAAALELEKLVVASDTTRISAIIDQLCGMFSSSSSALHTRNGGLIGLAATAIALGQDVAPFLGVIIPPVLACFQDPESRVRYHACESLYNIAKVSKGEILVYFNEIFDALSKLASDSEMSVKNGAELLDRLMKDIVAEAAPSYVSLYPAPDRTNGLGLSPGGGEKDPSAHPSPARSGRQEHEGSIAQGAEDKRAFSLARFIPLLSERVYVISPYTRMHLVSWIMVLDSVPDLELVAWLPEFLDGLLKYLADSNVDVRLATENVLAEFLREIKYIANVQEKQVEAERHRRDDRDRLHKQESKQTMDSAIVDGDDDESMQDDDSEADGTADDTENDNEHEHEHEHDNEWEGEGSGAWVPGQGVFVDHAAIMDIIIQHLSYPDELVQSTAMEWILTFLDFAQTTVVAFTPRLVPAILPNLASPHRHIKVAAHETNSALCRVIQSLSIQVLPPATVPPPSVLPSAPAGSVIPPSSSFSSLAISPPKNLLSESPDKNSAGAMGPLPTAGAGAPTHDPLEGKPLTVTTSVKKISSEPVTPASTEFPPNTARPTGTGAKTRPQSPVPQTAQAPMSPVAETFSDDDPFDVRETVNVLTLQFLSDHPETRIAALEWLLMLHLKAPNKILSRDSGTFPALLKTLSDPSEDVVKHDLQLLAQISSSSEDSYFTSFMVNVLELFSTDRRLLETRGSLIIRQLCLHLNAEKIFRTLAEILEKDDDLEFASMMVVKLNIILITSPELADFRRRLKNLDSKDGQMLFSSLYRSWCHNAVAAFALCLLAQAYEHASNLLEIFAELEITVPLLVQIDKLVMLIESPVFTNLRLQLLKPDKHPFLPKCLYGLLMILPQSSAFVSLRARLSVVNSAGYVPTSQQQPAPKPPFSTTPSSSSTRSKLGKDEIKWQELLSHFHQVQMRHENARRQQSSGESGFQQGSLHFSTPSQTSGLQSAAQITSGGVGNKGYTGSGGTTTRRRAGGSSQGYGSGNRQDSLGDRGERISMGATGLSPLNPKRATTTSAGTSAVGGGGGGHGSGSGSGAGSALMAAGVSIGGAVASMNGAQGLGSMRPSSPQGRRRGPVKK